MNVEFIFFDDIIEEEIISSETPIEEILLLKGETGSPGADGADGVSPTLTETATTEGYDITITDINGTRTITLLNGKDGADGQQGPEGKPGKDGANGSDGFSPTITETQTSTGYNISITDKTGTNTISIHNGADGQPGPAGADGKDGKDGQNGQNGQDGYTPVRGTDYWTSSDISTIEQYCADYIDANITQAIGGSY